jgi:hypothetical protein
MYGIAIDAAPVVVANLIVAGAALYSSFAPRRTEGNGVGHLSSRLRKNPTFDAGHGSELDYDAPNAAQGGAHAR